jgi:hypothetical protein
MPSEHRGWGERYTYIETETEREREREEKRERERGREREREREGLRERGRVGERGRGNVAKGDSAFVEEKSPLAENAQSHVKGCSYWLLWKRGTKRRPVFACAIAFRGQDTVYGDGTVEAGKAKRTPFAGVPHSQEPPPPKDPTVGLNLGI